jgi:hypothetical protein
MSIILRRSEYIVTRPRSSYTTTVNLCTGGLVSLYTGGSRNRLWCTACDVKQHHRRTSTEKLYNNGRKPIFSGVFRNRQC